MHIGVAGSSHHAASLSLADGSRIGVVPAGERRDELAARLRKEMQLESLTDRCDSMVFVAGEKPASVGYIFPRIGMPFVGPFREAPALEDVTAIVIQQSRNLSSLPVDLDLVCILMAIGLCAQDRGGVLLHGAFVEQHGNGIILAGPGGIGKTTAAQRLPYPWQALSDDATLVVRDVQGGFWAHPWPTWSQFVLDGPRGSWNMPRSVRLRGIFVLARAEFDQAESVGPGQAVTLMNEASKQAWAGMSPYFEDDQRRIFEYQRFNTICTLAATVPTHILRLTPTGEFWKTIENALDIGEQCPGPHPAAR